MNERVDNSVQVKDIDIVIILRNVNSEETADARLLCLKLLRWFVFRNVYMVYRTFTALQRSQSFRRNMFVR